MNRIIAAVLAIFFVLAPSLAIADDNDTHRESRESHLQDAEEYRVKASSLEGEVAKLGYRLQWVVTELIDIYYDLSDTRVEMADAAGTRDGDREELLAVEYYTLKAEEERLWDEIERSNR